ncbi:MAG TPA: tRNA pseudouridine(55) synthase TruB [Ruminiclostridium sp.]|jgi:tRNA pseudouridine55 synthase|nr:tRNA pseudouridine(55) synthase TruB [Clostridiaceae bacterium]HAA24899.1 tRNA pseudouridine(55) synthase TruB [Ruminiclostridium sp.]
MNGILLLIKPPNMTSFDVIAWLRKITGIKKIGHAGTLDPAACGLLPVCIGKATKTLPWFSEFDKSYRVEMILGIATDTYDNEGNILSKNPVKLDKSLIKSVIFEFTGEIEQTPPMYSAVKVGGRRLYELARKGIEVERKPRRITIYDIDILDIKDEGTYPVVRFDVKCSKGTYIRSLCNDIGIKLGYGAHMSFLIRTGVGPFSLADAVTLEEIEKRLVGGTLEPLIRAPDIVFSGYPSVVLEQKDLIRFVNGAVVFGLPGINAEAGSYIRVYAETERFIGLGTVLCVNGEKAVKPEKLFIDR